VEGGEGMEKPPGFMSKSRGFYFGIINTALKLGIV